MAQSQACMTSCSGRLCSSPAAGLASFHKPCLPRQSSSVFARRCLARPVQQRHIQPISCSLAAARGNPSDVKPAFLKYMSRFEVKEYNSRMVMDVSGRNLVDARFRPVTPWSFFLYPFQYVYYNTPGPIRYLGWLVWSRVLALGQLLHKLLVLQGAKLDVELMRRQKSNASVKFSRALVLMRFHRRMQWQDTLIYRLRLLQGRSMEESTELAKLQQKRFRNKYLGRNLFTNFLEARFLAIMSEDNNQ